MAKPHSDDFMNPELDPVARETFIHDHFLEKVTLTGDNFRNLVAGKAITVDAVFSVTDPPGIRKIRMLLSDIGFGVMKEAIREAERVEDAASNNRDQSEAD